MKTVGFPIPLKENEKRRAIIPHDLDKVSSISNLYFETGYGDVLGYSDDSYRAKGANICSRDEALRKDIICDPKVGDSEYLNNLKENQIIFGWIHAVQNRAVTDILVKNKVTAIAWEDMEENGRHTFWRNNEIAGEAAIMHAYLLHGLFPYNTKVALIGRGNIARGALKILTVLGADVKVYERKTENLLRREIQEFDVVVNGVLWDTNRDDHILFEEDIKRMKNGSLIIDISCDRNGGIATSIPTSIENPTYTVEGVTHYVVDHTPALFFKTVSETLSASISRFLDALIKDEKNETLESATIISSGIVKDEKIKKFQKR